MTPKKTVKLNYNTTAQTSKAVLNGDAAVMKPGLLVRATHVISKQNNIFYKQFKLKFYLTLKKKQRKFRRNIVSVNSSLRKKCFPFDAIILCYLND
jgi:hypothetical protein